MKKLIYLISISFCIISCGQSTGNESNETLSQNTAESRDSLTLWESDFVLDFINGYVENCNESENRMDIADWVNSSNLVTAEFKKDLTKIIYEAMEENPEIGLEFDPIFDAQDYPAEGFEIESLDPVSNLVYLKGKEWDDFNLNVKAKFVDGEWLVDGCGVVNMPEKDRAER